MGTRMRDLLGSALQSPRYEPTEKHLRISLDGEPVADTVNGLLVWEPRRVVPTYPFTAHTCTGEMFDVIAGARRRTSAAFRPDDPDLAGYVTFDFSAFERHEEDERIVAPPHDPFKHINILASSRHIQLEWDGRQLADSSRPLLLFETSLPVRFYLPRADVVVDLEPTGTVSFCAYKGRASYFSVPDGPADVAWAYHQPLREAEPVRDYVAFFNERVDVIVDGQRRQRP